MRRGRCMKFGTTVGWMETKTFLSFSISIVFLMLMLATRQHRHDPPACVRCSVSIWWCSPPSFKIWLKFRETFKWKTASFRFRRMSINLFVSLKQLFNGKQDFSQTNAQCCWTLRSWGGKNKNTKIQTSVFNFFFLFFHLLSVDTIQSKCFLPF